MLSIETKYQNGILFVRLKGELNQKTKEKFQKNVTDIVKKIGITNLVINLDNVTKIDLEGISELFSNYRLVNKYKGNSFICGINDKISANIKNSSILSFIPEINNEENAMRVIKWMK